MLSIIPNTKLKKGDPFSMVDIPLDVKGKSADGSEKYYYEPTTLEDFQWWAYSEDWDRWFRSSGKSWSADESQNYESPSADIVKEWAKDYLKDGKAIKSFDDFINESLAKSAGNKRYEGDGYYVVTESDGTRVMYTHARLNEEDSEGEENAITPESLIKFTYAYNYLKSQNAISEDFDMSTLNESDVKAVFVMPSNLKTDEEKSLMGSLHCLRVKVKKGFGSSSGRLGEIDLAYPGPIKISAKFTSEAIVNTIFKSVQGLSVAVLGTLGLGSGIYGIATIAGVIGGPILLMNVFNYMRFGDVVKALSNAKDAKAVESLKNLNIYRKNAAKMGKNLGWFGRAFRWIGSGFGIPKGIRTAARFSRTLKNVSRGVRILKTAAAFAKGVGKAANAAKLTNPVGWILLGVDAIGSLMNWYGPNQAPMPGDAVKEFNAKDSFNPKMIKIGERITFCWAQPAETAWGIAAALVVSNIGETRTVLDMVKFADSDDYSYFAVLSANSKWLNGEISDCLMFILAFDNSVTLKQGWHDNMDADVFAAKVKSVTTDELGNEIPVPYNFQGICNWETFEQAYNSRQETFFVADGDAPKIYNWNYEDVDGNVVNVIGNLVTDEYLRDLDQQEMEDLFLNGVNAETGEIVKPQPTMDDQEEETDGTETGTETETETETDDTEETEETENVVNESGRVSISFNEFASRIYKNSNISETNGNDPADGTTMPNSAEPAVIAIYICDPVKSKQYANPELRGKDVKSVFSNFSVSKDAYAASPGTDIAYMVAVNSNDEIISPKAGHAKFNADVIKREEEDIRREERERENIGAEDSEGVQAGDKVEGEGVIIKKRRGATVIKDKDKDGGTDLMELFVSDRDKVTLGIPGWEKVTMIKGVKNDAGDITKVVMRNKDASFGDRSRDYKPEDGNSFDVAKRILRDAETKIEYNPDEKRGLGKIFKKERDI
jgi:hypothetical protein